MMKTLYEPSNALEAHMLHDLLQQEGIATRINGAYLQGGVGELPASGLVHLVVAEEDYERARAVIQRWEATEVPDPTPPLARQPSHGFVAVLLGALIGVAVTYAFFRVPVSVDGIDHNNDSVLDERWSYSAGGVFLGSKIDRNFDGKPDYVTHADRRGRIVSTESDDNFDGVFETRNRVHTSSDEVAEVDTDGDGYPDVRFNYRYGVQESVEYLNPHSGWPVRVEHYRLGIRTAAEVDTNNDGKLDTRYSYSRTAEITRQEAIDPPR
jgi:hypothetical protein